MMAYERFDVLTALFPFVDIPQRKPRPVVVLSSGSFDVSHGQVVAAMITTGADSSWPSDLVVGDLAATGLRHRSVIRMKLFTLPVTVVGRRIGTLGESDRRALETGLSRLIGADGA